MLRAIIFDMDGVICDSEDLHMKAFQEVLSQESIIITDQEYYDRYLAHDDRGSFLAAFTDHGQPAPDPQKMKSLLMRKSKVFDVFMRDGLVIFPGVDAFVRKVSAKYALALATGARRLEAEFVLKKAGLRDVFAAVVSADDVANGKPEPEAFERALKMLNQMRLDGTPEINSSEVVVIEDSPRCIRTVKGMGMKAVGMATSYPKDSLREADLVIDTFVRFPAEQLEKLFV
jgi:beta-phosphoglucomutase